MRCSKQATKAGAMLLLGLGCGCSGPQSALDPASREAEIIAELWWWMLGGGVAVWAIMLALSWYAIFAPRGRHYQRLTTWIVIGGGAIFPTIVLTALLCFGLARLPKLLGPAPPGSLTIEVDGLQWWWRVRYASAPIELASAGQPSGTEANSTDSPRLSHDIELANEIWLPVNKPVEFRLRSQDVIHSFWIPALGGKVDMIPGRQTRLVVHPRRPGLYRGVCAEFCGASHALMDFYVRVVSEEEFQQWLQRQHAPGRLPSSDAGRRGQSIFQSAGCGACHRLRGTEAAGSVGPDLTHVGSRHSIGAGILPSDRSAIVHWLRDTEHIKPGVHMPNFRMLDSEQLDDLAAYLEELK